MAQEMRTVSSQSYSILTLYETAEAAQATVRSMLLRLEKEMNECNPKMRVWEQERHTIENRKRFAIRSATHSATISALNSMEGVMSDLDFVVGDITRDVKVQGLVSNAAFEELEADMPLVPASESPSVIFEHELHALKQFSASDLLDKLPTVKLPTNLVEVCTSRTMKGMVRVGDAVISYTELTDEVKNGSTGKTTEGAEDKDV